jgi:hypothetical protein
MCCGRISVQDMHVFNPYEMPDAANTSLSEELC